MAKSFNWVDSQKTVTRGKHKRRTINSGDLAQKGGRVQLEYTRGWGDNETQVKHIEVVTTA